MSYSYLFKYIIIGDTGRARYNSSFLREVAVEAKEL